MSALIVVLHHKCGEHNIADGHSLRWHFSFLGTIDIFQVKPHEGGEN